MEVDEPIDLSDFALERLNLRGESLDLCAQRGDLLVGRSTTGTSYYQH